MHHPILQHSARISRLHDRELQPALNSKASFSPLVAETVAQLLFLCSYITLTLHARAQALQLPQDRLVQKQHTAALHTRPHQSRAHAPKPARQTLRLVDELESREDRGSIQIDGARARRVRARRRRRYRSLLLLLEPGIYLGCGTQSRR